MLRQGANQNVAPQEDDDLEAWKRSSVNDEKVPSINRLNASLGGGGGSGSQHSGTALAGGRGSGHNSGTSQSQTVAKVHYITPNATGAAVTTMYTSTESGAVMQPSTTVLVAYPPVQHLAPQVTYIVVDNGGNNPLGVGAVPTAGPNSSTAGGSLSANADFSGNRYSSTALAGSLSGHHGSGMVMAPMGGSGSAFALSGTGAGGSGHHIHAHVRTITIQPSSSHTLSDPSSSSGPGSTNDYYPVFVNQSDHHSVTDPTGRSDTTDLSSGDRNAALLQQHLMQQHQHISHSHLPVLLPDGTMVAPHAHPQGQHALPHHLTPNQTILINAHTGLPVQEDAMMRSGVGDHSSSSTTTNVAVWGGSASAGRQFAGNSSSIISQQVVATNPQIAQQALHSNMYMMNAPSYLQSTQSIQHHAPSHFIGGRGRGGGVQQQVFATPSTAQSQPPQFQSGGRGMTVGGRGRGVAGNAQWAAPPKAVQPQMPSLGPAPSILVGKLPTPVFTQTVSIGGQKVNTSGLVAPRFPAQGEEVVVGVSAGTSGVKVGGVAVPAPPTNN